MNTEKCCFTTILYKSLKKFEVRHQFTKPRVLLSLSKKQSLRKWCMKICWNDNKCLKVRLNLLSVSLFLFHTPTHTRCKVFRTVQTLQFHGRLLFLWLIQGDRSDLLQRQINQLGGRNPEGKPMLFLSRCNTTRCHKLSPSVMWIQTPAGFLTEGRWQTAGSHMCASLWLPVSPHVSISASYPASALVSADRLICCSKVTDFTPHCAETSVLFLVSSTHSRAPVSDPDPRLMKNKNEWINNSLAWGGGMLSVRHEPNALPVSWDGSAHVSPLSFSANKHYLTLHTHLLRWALIISGNPPHELGCCFPPFCLPLRPSSSYTQRIMSVVKPKVLTGWHSAPVLSVSLRAADHSFLKSSLVRVCWEGVWRRWVKMSWCWK